MNVDIVQKNRDLRRYGEKSSFDAFFWVAFFLLFVAVTYIYYWEAAPENSDIHLHAVIASGFSFRDLHSITSRIVYPFWHLNFAVLYKLGVPLRVGGDRRVRRLQNARLHAGAADRLPVPRAGSSPQSLRRLAALAAMFVTAVRIPSRQPQRVHRHRLAQRVAQPHADRIGALLAAVRILHGALLYMLSEANANAGGAPRCCHGKR